ncbi:MAG: beta-glucosidase BglX [Colwellia sp.]|nr:beta-glucosidase BglX [Colwellia sp.]
MKVIMKSLSRISVSLILASSLTACFSESNSNSQQGISKVVIVNHESVAMNDFVNELLSKMTLEEKIGQMNLLTSDLAVTGPSIRDDYKEDIKNGRVGAIFNAFTPEYTREMQRMAVEETRLGIPLLFGFDVIHGHKTIFPIPLGESASWDMKAIELGSRIAAKEASADGIHWTFAPMVDIARDPRWGRISESAGEDVYLSKQIAKARVKGFQGDDLNALDTILACAKHYAAYGQAQAGRDYHSTDMSQRELWETYLPPFEATIDAGVATIMTSFNDLNGVPATGNKYLLDDVLRQHWGFDGFVVTDYTSINEMVPHGFAVDNKHAASLALNAGVDMDMQGSVYHNHLKVLLDEGKITLAQIDTATQRILEMKYKLGLFQDPYRYSNEERAASDILNQEHLNAARDVARKSMVLLKNENNVLPLSTKINSIALIGPLADSKADMIGSWVAAGDRTTQPVSILEGINARAGNNVKVHYVEGASYLFEAEGITKGFAEAIAVAKTSDVIVLAMGEKWNMTGEATSRTSLDMPGNQIALMKALKKLNKPMVLVLMSGRPMTIEWEQDNLDSIVMAWYPGTMGGHAVADVLFGDYNPSAKLPVTFPRTVGQVPIYYNMKNTGRPFSANNPEQKYVSRYLNTSNTPLYPFGHGLSYTNFDYSEIKLSSTELTNTNSIVASVTVTNSGKYDGDEVVQLYVRDLVGSVTRPVKELKGFKKIHIGKSKSAVVSFDITAKDLAFYRKDMSFGTEIGDHKLFIGTDSENLKEVNFKIVERANLLSNKYKLN